MRYFLLFVLSLNVCAAPDYEILDDARKHSILRSLIQRFDPDQRPIYCSIKIDDVEKFYMYHPFSAPTEYGLYIPNDLYTDLIDLFGAARTGREAPLFQELENWNFLLPVRSLASEHPEVDDLKIVYRPDWSVMILIGKIFKI